MLKNTLPCKVRIQLFVLCVIGLSGPDGQHQLSNELSHRHNRDFLMFCGLATAIQQPKCYFNVNMTNCRSFFHNTINNQLPLFMKPCMLFLKELEHRKLG